MNASKSRSNEGLMLLNHDQVNYFSVRLLKLKLFDWKTLVILLADGFSLLIIKQLNTFMYYYTKCI